MTDEHSEQVGFHQIVTRYADGTVGLAVRSAIATIPIVGGGLSLLVEAQLAARQAARIDLLYTRLAELEASRNTGEFPAAAARPSEGLVEFATGAAVSTFDQARPRVFADILFLSGAGDDRSEIVRRFLVEAMATLTRYEVALLLRHGRQRDSAVNTAFAEELLKTEAESADVEDVKQFSLYRLKTFRLISDLQHGEVELTPMGKHLLSTI